MKKIFTLISAFTVITAVQAQTITSSSFPVVGETWVEYIDTAGTAVVITPAGAGQNWNHASSFTVSDTNSFTYQSLAQAPAFTNITTLFPAGSSMQVDINNQDTLYSIFKSNATGLYVDGLYQNGLLEDASLGINIKHFDFNPDVLMIPAPFSLNDTRSNNARYDVAFQYIGFDITIKSYTIQSFSADANGTLITPKGTFNNVLRIKEFNYIIDSTTYVNPDPLAPPIDDVINIHDTSITYNFVQANSHCLLMTVSVNPSTMQTSRASYYEATSTSSLQENENSLVTLYPNPAVDEFYLNNIRHNSSIQIFDVAGKLVKQQSLAGFESTVKVNTNDMQAGMYFFTITNDKGGNYFSSKFQVSK